MNSKSAISADVIPRTRLSQTTRHFRSSEYGWGILIHKQIQISRYYALVQYSLRTYFRKFKTVAYAAHALVHVYDMSMHNIGNSY